MTLSLVELADRIEAIRNSADVFNPDARAAAYSTFAAAEELWKLAPEIIAALRARGQQQ
jgi:hypothetical protein